MPRVVHLTVAHDPRDPRIVHKQCRTLHEAGYALTLVAPTVAAPVRPPVPWHPLPGDCSRLRRLGAALRGASGLNADVYHIHDPDLLPVAYVLRRRTGARVIYDMHEDFRSHRSGLVGRLIRTVERWAFGWLDHVVLAERGYRPILTGETVPHTCIENYHRPYADTHVSPAASNGPFRLLYTGSISRSRGLFHMLDVAQRLKADARPERLSLVGICRPDEQRAAAQQRIRREGLDAVVDRTGWTRYVPPETMPTHYRKADVGVALFQPIPNHMRSLLTKFYEYLHYGLPILASDVPLWRRFVETHDCGAVVPPGDAAAVLRVLDRWHANPARFQTLVANARRVSERFRWHVMAQRLLDLYGRLVGAPGGRSRALDRGYGVAGASDCA